MKTIKTTKEARNALILQRLLKPQNQNLLYLGFPVDSLVCSKITCKKFAKFRMKTLHGTEQ